MMKMKIKKNKENLKGVKEENENVAIVLFVMLTLRGMNT